MGYMCEIKVEIIRLKQRNRNLCGKRKDKQRFVDFYYANLYKNPNHIRNNHPKVKVYEDSIYRATVEINQNGDEITRLRRLLVEKRCV